MKKQEVRCQALHYCAVLIEETAAQCEGPGEFLTEPEEKEFRAEMYRIADRLRKKLEKQERSKL